MTTATDRFLLFELGPDRYGIPVGCVEQIVELQPTTRVLRAPVWLRGLMNLRGRVISLVDLRALLGLPAVDHEFAACVVVIKGASCPLGVVVDRVLEVATIARASIEPPPEAGTTVDTRYLIGVARVGDGLVLLMDAARALSPEEIAMLDKVAGSQP